MPVYRWLFTDSRPAEVGLRGAPFWLTSTLFGPRMSRCQAWAGLLFCFSGMSGKSCILCILSIHNTHESILFVESFVLDWFIDGSVNNEGVIDDPDPIGIRFESVPDFCSIEDDPASDDVITFTDWPHFCHPGCRFWHFTPTWLCNDPFWSPCIWSNNVAWNATSYREADVREAQ